MKTIVIALMCFIGIQTVNAQETSKTKKKTETIVIQTHTNCSETACGEYKEFIETGLNYLNGVIFAELDHTTRKVTVKYKVNEVTPQKIREAIANTGYDADDVKATPEGIKNLPSCCKPH